MDEVCVKIQDGTHFSPNRQLPQGRYRYITAKNIRPWGLDLSEVTYLEDDDHRAIYGRCDPRRGDVLLVKDGVNTGDAALNTLDEEFSLLSSVCLIRPNRSVLDGPFLRYFLLSPIGYRLLTGQMTGTAIKRIILRRIKEIPVPIAPLAEQHRVVKELEKQLTRLDAAVGALKRIQGKLKRYRASVLKAACGGRLVPTEADLARAEGRDYESGGRLLARIVKERRARWEADRLARVVAGGRTPKDDKWKAKYDEPTGPDISSLPELPEGWAWATMPQLGELNRGKSKHRPRNDPRLLSGPYPFIQTGDIRHSAGRIRAHSQTYSEFGLAQSRLWPTGTLCITIAANIAATGILAYPACFPDSVVGFRYEADPIVVQFIELFLRTARKELEGSAPATAQKNINLEMLSDVAIPMPPLAEQRRIVTEVERRLSVIDEMEAVVAASLNRAERLRQAILKRAFSGGLVPQDPSDEPASALLERIRKEGVNAQAAPTGHAAMRKGQRGLSMRGTP